MAQLGHNDDLNTSIPAAQAFLRTTFQAKAKSAQGWGKRIFMHVATGVLSLAGRYGQGRATMLTNAAMPIFLLLFGFGNS